MQFFDVDEDYNDEGPYDDNHKGAYHDHDEGPYDNDGEDDDRTADDHDIEWWASSGTQSDSCITLGQ